MFLHQTTEKQDGNGHLWEDPVHVFNYTKELKTPTVNDTIAINDVESTCITSKENRISNFICKFSFKRDQNRSLFHIVWDSNIIMWESIAAIAFVNPS